MEEVPAMPHHVSVEEEVMYARCRTKAIIQHHKDAHEDEDVEVVEVVEVGKVVEAKTMVRSLTKR